MSADDKRPNEDSLEKLAKRMATEINENAGSMTLQERALADSETEKIADRVRHRTC